MQEAAGTRISVTPRPFFTRGPKLCSVPYLVADLMWLQSFGFSKGALRARICKSLLPGQWMRHTAHGKQGWCQPPSRVSDNEKNPAGGVEHETNDRENEMKVGGSSATNTASKFSIAQQNCDFSRARLLRGGRLRKHSCGSLGPRC